MANWLATDNLGAEYIFGQFLWMSVAGPLFGIACAVASLLWLQSNKAVDHDANVEITVTLAMPFLV